MQQLNLSLFYKNDESFRKNIRKILLVAFLKPKNVLRTYSEIKRIIKSDFTYLGLDDLFVYLERMYIGECKGDLKEREPIFPIQTWSVFERRNKGSRVIITTQQHGTVV
jgi:hypothetical protein